MLEDFFNASLCRLAGQGLARSLHPIESAQGSRLVREGREVLCFCSNNYLGLAGDSRVATAAKEALDRYGVGSGASRLITGSMLPHHHLEERLAAFKRVPAVLSFATGYQANLAAVQAGAGDTDLICSDALNHASIIDACRLSRATVKVFPHKGYDVLESILKGEEGYSRRLIVSDSVFSVDGDFADLRRLVEIKYKYGAALCIDEAHATGVLGAGGRGLAEMQGVEEHIDIVVGTLSKAVGVMGGFVAGSRRLIDYLISTGRPFIYSTAPPPAIAAAAATALDLVEAESWRRYAVAANAVRVRSALAVTEDLGNSCCPIIPIGIGDAGEALAAADRLLACGILVPAIRPPTVPEGTARLRITVMATHSREDIGVLLAALGHVPGIGLRSGSESA